MRLRDSPSAYGPVTRANHWIGALFVLSMLVIGLYFSELPPGAERSFWRTLHIAIGTILLPLAVFRVLWRFVSGAPQALPQLPAARALASITHILLMVAMLTMLASGILMQWFAGRPIGVFDLLRIGSPLIPSELWHERMQLIHDSTAWALIGLIALHLLGAVRNTLRSGRKFWERMLGTPSK